MVVTRRAPKKQRWEHSSLPKFLCHSQSHLDARRVEAIRRQRAQPITILDTLRKFLLGAATILQGRSWIACHPGTAARGLLASSFGAQGWAHNERLECNRVCTCCSIFVWHCGQAGGVQRKVCLAGCLLSDHMWCIVCVSPKSWCTPAAVHRPYRHGFTPDPR